MGEPASRRHAGKNAVSPCGSKGVFFNRDHPPARDDVGSQYPVKPCAELQTGKHNVGGATIHDIFAVGCFCGSKRPNVTYVIIKLVVSRGAKVARPASAERKRVVQFSAFLSGFDVLWTESTIHVAFIIIISIEHFLHTLTKLAHNMFNCLIKLLFAVPVSRSKCASTIASCISKEGIKPVISHSFHSLSNRFNCGIRPRRVCVCHVIFHHQQRVLSKQRLQRIGTQSARVLNVPPQRFKFFARCACSICSAKRRASPCYRGWLVVVWSIHWMLCTRINMQKKMARTHTNRFEDKFTQLNHLCIHCANSCDCRFITADSGLTRDQHGITVELHNGE